VNADEGRRRLAVIGALHFLRRVTHFFLRLIVGEREHVANLGVGASERDEPIETRIVRASTRISRKAHIFRGKGMRARFGSREVIS